MPHYSQQDSLAYEMSNSDQTWQSLPGEELFTGGTEGNAIINPVFDAELMTNWQMTDFDQVHLSGEPFLENAQFPFHAELTAHHWPLPMANHSLRAPTNDGSANQMPQTHQSLQRPFDGGSPANQIRYPVPYQSSNPAWEQREGGGTGETSTIRTYEVPAYDLHATAILQLAASDPLPLSNANATATSASPPIAAPAHPLTGRYPCSYPTCAQDFKRPSDRVRHIFSVHQRGQTTQGKNLCPIVGCRRSYGKGLCRPDKVNDHLKKVHGLVRITPNGGAASAGPSARGTGH